MNKTVVTQTAKFVKNKLESETTGHDWWHSWRVWKIAKHIATLEKGVGVEVIEVAALLHDISDWKFNDEKQASVIVSKFLKKLKVDKQLIEKIIDIVENVSFKGAFVKGKNLSREGKIVQDADRIDALGAIGIARCFATGSKLNRKIYDPKIKPTLHKTFTDYKNKNSTSINHFHEKLYLLIDKMHTKTAKQIAAKRLRFLKQFEKRFLEEWDAKF